MILKLKKMVQFSALLFCIILSGCFFNYYEWKQKIVVTITTPSGDVSGESVSLVQFRQSGIEKANYGFKINGEAVAIMLDNGKYIFAGLEDNYSDGLRARDAYGSRVKRKNYKYKVRHKLVDIPEVKGQAVIYSRTPKGIIKKARHFSSMPPLYTFKDTNNIKSLTKLSPENLEEFFGKGYHLKSVTLEITDQPATTGIIEKIFQNSGLISETKKFSKKSKYYSTFIKRQEYFN